VTVPTAQPLPAGPPATAARGRLASPRRGGRSWCGGEPSRRRPPLSGGRNERRTGKGDERSKEEDKEDRGGPHWSDPGRPTWFKFGRGEPWVALYPTRRGSVRSLDLQYSIRFGGPVTGPNQTGPSHRDPPFTKKIPYSTIYLGKHAKYYIKFVPDINIENKKWKDLLHNCIYKFAGYIFYS
jgi:hypothetical protein